MSRNSASFNPSKAVMKWERLIKKSNLSPEFRNQIERNIKMLTPPQTPPRSYLKEVKNIEPPVEKKPFFAALFDDVKTIAAPVFKFFSRSRKNYVKNP